MLTNTDLSQIKTIVKEIVIDSENRIKKELKAELVSKKDFESSIADIKSEMATLVTKKELGRATRKIWAELKFIRETLNYTIDTFEGDIIKLKKHLGLW